jgi:tryptophan synthase beta subunit
VASGTATAGLETEPARMALLARTMGAEAVVAALGAGRGLVEAAAQVELRSSNSRGNSECSQQS